MKKRRILPLFLSAAMVLGSCAAFAAQPDGGWEQQTLHNRTEEEPENQPPGEIAGLDQETAEKIKSGALLMNQDGSLEEPETADGVREVAAAAGGAMTVAQVIGTNPALEEARAEGKEEPDNILPADIDDPVVQKYKDYSYYDPQWIPDEALFGVWDAEQQTWVPQTFAVTYKGNRVTKTVNGPLLQYDLEKYWDTLHPIEEYAKRGDYAACKMLLKEHYIVKFDRLPVKPQAGTSRAKEVTSLGYMYNAWGNGAGGTSVNEAVYMPAQADWTTTDVTGMVQAVAAAEGTDDLELEIVSAERDGYRALIDSNQGVNKPYLELEKESGTVRIPVKADTTMKAGQYRTTPFGMEPVLEVEESIDTIGLAYPVDDRTARALLRFDLKDLTAADNVKRATLYLYGSSGRPDGAEDKLLFFYNVPMTQFDEASYTWSSQRHSKVTSEGEIGIGHYQVAAYGESGNIKTDDMIEGMMCNASRLAEGSMGQMFRATGDERYAYHGLRWLINYHMKYGYLDDLPAQLSTNSPHPDKLSMGNRGQSYQWRVFDFLESKYMTPEVLTILIKEAWVTSEQLVGCWTSQEATTNWGATQAAGLLNMSLYFDEFADCHTPLSDVNIRPSGNGKSGGWRAVAAYRQRTKMDELIFPDGACTEVALGYASYSLSSFMSAYNMFVNNGMEKEFPQEIMDGIVTMSQYLMYVSAPNQEGYNQGNAHEHGNATIRNQIKSAASRSQDPYLLYVSGQGGSKPPQTSKIYPYSKKFTTRSGWDKNAVASHFNADGGMTTHGHADDLAFDLYAYGEHLLIDNGCVNYNDDVRRLHEISTRGHNTVEINGVGQRTPSWNLVTREWPDPFTGEPLYLVDQGELEFGYFMNAELNRGYDYLRAGTNGYKDRTVSALGKKFDDFKNERSVFFVRPDYYIITDYMEPLTKPDSENTYDQRWYFMPGVSAQIDPVTKVARTTKDKGANVVIAPVNQQTPINADTGHGYYSPTSGAAVVNENVTYTKIAKGKTAMDTLVYPVKAGDDVDVQTQNIELDVPEGDASAFSATITDNKRNNVQEITKYEKHNERENMELKGIGDYSSDGYLMFVEQTNGKTTGAVLQGGTQLQDEDGNSLIFAGERVEGISVTWGVGQMELDTDKTIVRDKEDTDPETEIDLNKLTVYAPDVVGSVLLNGAPVEYKRSGNYIYFGAQPPIEDSRPQPSPTPSGGGGPGGSGGSGGASHGNSGMPAGTGFIPTLPPTPTPVVPQSSGLKAELSGHWAEAEIGALIDQGIVAGNGKTLDLTGNVTRAEFITMLTRALEIAPENYQGGMADVSADDWFADAVQAGISSGLMVGSGGLMRPDAQITREEMAKIIAAAYEYKTNKQAPAVELPFTDAADISGWAKDGIQKACGLGLLNGFETGAFLPRTSALREQAMIVIWRLLQQLE